MPLVRPLWAALLDLAAERGLRRLRASGALRGAAVPGLRPLAGRERTVAHAGGCARHAAHVRGGPLRGPGSHDADRLQGTRPHGSAALAGPCDARAVAQTLDTAAGAASPEGGGRRRR